jgi:hypothetical protein
VTRASRAVLLLLALVVIACRLAHVDLLWVEEAYGLAAAREILAGKSLYSQIWFDKPPIYAWIYLLWGAKTGLILRLAGAAHVLLSCWLAYRCACAIWPTAERQSSEGLFAAGLLGFYLTFGIPSAVIALAPDLLMVPLHLAAMWMAFERRPLAAGLFSGLALMVNAKGLFVFASVMIFTPGLLALLGFALPNATLAAFLWSSGSWSAYVEQVWTWGMLYARDPYLSPIAEGTKRTLSWLGFHATLVAGAGAFFTAKQDRRIRLALWIGLSLIAVAGGARFFPRYYFHLLVPMVIVGARGLTILLDSPTRPRRTLAFAALALLLIPLLRFGPRHVTLAAETLANKPHEWRDLALNNDSREVAEWLRANARPKDKLLVWGYRPDVLVLSGLGAATPFLDSQPLNGVLADRHLTISKPTAPEWAERHRQLLVQTTPEWIVDGLGPLNPELAIARLPDLASWLSKYREVSRTKTSVIYRRID